MVACFTTVAFTTVSLIPQSLVAVDVRTINFGIRIEKIYEKVKRSIDKGETNRIVAYMHDIKHEVEQFVGKKIDISKAIDQLQKEAKARGQKIDDKYINQIKRDFIKEDKKRNHRSVWFSQCAELDIPYTSLEADMHFDMNYSIDKGTKGKEEKREEVPITIMVGVTVGLCGLFLFFVPLPGCQTAGAWLLNAGIGILSSHAVEKWDAYDQDQRNKDK
jgi:hypothetical protein